MAERSFRWVDETWWRDWIVWVAAAVATGNLVAGLVREHDAWWWLLWRWGYSFVVVIALLGFGRVVVRTYRAPASGDR